MGDYVKHSLQILRREDVGKELPVDFGREEFERGKENRADDLLTRETHPVFISFLVFYYFLWVPVFAY